MKAFFALLAMNLLGLTTIAQMTLSLNEMPDRNTQILYSYGNTNSTIDHSLTGANHTWDYSSLDYVFQDSLEYQSAVSINPFFLTLGFNAFGTKTLDSLGFGQLQVRDVFDVYKTTSKKMTAEGRSINYNGLPIPQFYQDKDEVYRYPFTFQDTSRDSYLVGFSLGTTISIVQSGRRENIGEGWGKLITPYKTYNNVLKMKTTVQGTDTVKLGGFPLPITRNTLEYKWFAPGVKGPVLIVSGNVIFGRFTPTEIKFEDKPVPLLGFYADQVLVDTTQTVSIEDTSSVQALIRQWNIVPNTFEYQGGTNNRDDKIQVRFKKAGKYSVELTVTNRFGQIKESKKEYIEVIVLDNTGISENPSDRLTVFPNPFLDQIEVSDSDLDLQLLDLNGAVVAEGKGQIDELDKLPEGLYLLLGIKGTEVQFREKVIKR